MLIFDLKVIGENLRNIRERKGLKRPYIAEKANISERTYADIERGSTKMRIDTLLNICKALDVTPNEFLINEEQTVSNEEIVNRLNSCTDKQKYAAIKLLNSYLESL